MHIQGQCVAGPRNNHAARCHLLASNSGSKRRRSNSRVFASPEQTPELRDTIKRLTKLFYSDQTAEVNSRVVSAGHIGAPKSAQVGANCKNLPLWRVEWSVLPGSQEVLHVMAPHYVHMFERIFSRPRPWLFGHLYLPGGSKNLGSSNFELSSGSQSPLIGTLVQVTRAVRLRDGKFLILATAITRFKVCRCLQELPYSIADVQLFEDAELLEQFHQPALTAIMQAAPDDSSIFSLMAAGQSAAAAACAAVSWSWLRGYELRVAAQQEWPGPGPHEGESDLETHRLVQELMAHGVAEVLPLPDGVVIGRVNLTQVAAAADEALQQALQEAVQQLQRGDEPAEAEGTGDSTAVEAAGSSVQSALPITSLNTTAQRNVRFQGEEFSELISNSSASNSTADVLMLEAAIWAQLDTLVALASRVKGNRHSLPFGLLQLRPQPVEPRSGLWGRAAAAAASSGSQGDEAQQQIGRSTGTHSATVDQQAGSSSYSSSYGTDSSTAEAHSVAEADNTASTAEAAGQQQPQQPASMPEQVTSHPADEASSSRSQSENSVGKGSGGGSSGQGDHVQQQVLAASRYAFAASDGMDVYADPLWPPLRRAARLSWAAAAVVGHLEQDKGEMRQALLECTSVASRLRFMSAVLSKHIKVLSAIAAVKDVEI